MATITALLCVFGLGVCLSLLGSVSVRLIPRLKIDPKRFGVLVSATMFSCLAASLIVGVVTDLVGYKFVAAGGFLLSGACTLAIASAKHYRAAFVPCVLLGFGAMALNTAGNTLLPLVLFGGRNPAAALNLGNVCFGLGILLTPLIVSFLFQRTSYERAVGAVGVLLLAPATGALLASYPGSQGGFAVSDALPLLVHPVVLVAALMMFCYTSLETSFCNWLAPLGKEVIRRGDPALAERVADASAQRLLALFAIGMMAGRLTASQAPGITAYGGWYIAGGSAMTIAAVALARRGSGIGQARLAAVLAGIALAPIFPTIAGLTLRGFSPTVHGSIIGMIFVMGFLGASLAPRVIGALAQGSSVRNSLRLLFPLCFVLIILDVILVNVVR